MQNILFSFLFFLPAGIANMVPVIVAKLPVLSSWNFPLDFGQKLRGKRILGDHKTIRGLVSGVIVGTFVAIVEARFIGGVFRANPALVGCLLSFGALSGDSIKSFCKRRVGVAPGKSWFPFDQLDYIVGGTLLSIVVVRLSIIEYVTIMVVYFLLHLTVSFVGFLVGFKSSAI